MRAISQNVKKIFSEELWARFRPAQFKNFDLEEMPVSFRKDWDDRCSIVLDTTITRSKNVIVPERHFAALADGFSEFKANVVDGEKVNTLEEIIQHVITEIRESRE